MEYGALRSKAVVRSAPDDPTAPSAVPGNAYLTSMPNRHLDRFASRARVRQPTGVEETGLQAGSSYAI